MRRLLPALAAALLAGAALADEATTGIFSGHGFVEAVEPATGALTVRHDEIKGFMDAMTMMYKVKDPDVSRGLKAGDEITFTIDAAKYEILGAKVVGHVK